MNRLMPSAAALVAAFLVASCAADDPNAGLFDAELRDVSGETVPIDLAPDAPLLREFVSSFWKEELEIHRQTSKELGRELSLNLEVYGYLDLNGDGVDEIVVRMESSFSCGNSGNCPMVVVQRTDGRLAALIDEVPAQSVSFLPGHVVNGFKTLMFGWFKGGDCGYVAAYYTRSGGRYEFAAGRDVGDSDKPHCDVY